MDTTSSISSVVLPPEGKTHDLLKKTILSHRPSEAVGLIMSDGRVITLTNHADKPETRFEVSRSELFEVLQGETVLTGVVFWHSHPSGGIGPSRTDMQQKMPFFTHLVASIVDEDLVYTFY